MKKRISFVCCPECDMYTFQKIILTRVHDEDHRILRRRECLGCSHKWYTIQQPEESVDNMTERTFLRNK